MFPVKAHSQTVQHHQSHQQPLHRRPLGIYVFQNDANLPLVNVSNRPVSFVGFVLLLDFFQWNRIDAFLQIGSVKQGLLFTWELL